VLALMKHSWPGNVRELEGVVTSAATLCRGRVIEAENILFDDAITAGAATVLPEPQEGFNINHFLDGARQQLVDRALKMAAGNRTRAAELLGISPQAMSQYLKGQK